MEFTVEVNVTREPEKCDKYYTAFLRDEPLDTGSWVTEVNSHEEDGEVYITFKLRS